MRNLPDLPFEWANNPWMEPGSLPASLAPQGATLNPEMGDDTGDEGAAADDQIIDDDED